MRYHLADIPTSIDPETYRLTVQGQVDKPVMASTPDKTRPIGKLLVRSFITSVMPNEVLPAGHPIVLKGLAFDGGTGIKQVELSADGGRSWHATTLGQDLGRFSFREWQLPLTFIKTGETTLMVRATSNGGEVQPLTGFVLAQ